MQTGTDASRYIRDFGFTRLIIGITGNALDDDVAAFLLAGADCVIAKPLRANSLGENVAMAHSTASLFQYNDTLN